MSKKSQNQYRLDKLKKQAKKLSKEKGILQTEALEMIATELGFDSWFTCRREILQGHKTESVAQPSTPKKVFAQEYDPSIHSPADVRGMVKNGDEYIAQERFSFLNYVGEFFDSTNQFRNRLEHDVKGVIKNSKHHTSLHITVYADSPSLELFNSPSVLFDSILERYDRLTTLHVVQRDEPFTFDEYEQLLKGNLENFR